MSESTATATETPATTTETKPAVTDAKGATNGDTAASATKIEPTKDGKPAEQAKPTSVVPDTYTFRPPEGGTLDQAVLDAWTPALKEAGVSQEGAQKLFERFLAHEGDRAKAWQTQAEEAAKKAVTELREADKTAFHKDPEIGGPKAEASLRAANQVIDKLPNAPKFREALVSMGADNHPELVRGLVWLHSQFAEDFFSGTTQAGVDPTSDEALQRKMFTHPSSQAMFKG